MSRIETIRHLYRERVVKKHDKGFSLPDSEIFHTALEQVKEKGFATIENYFNSEQCSEAIALIENIISKSDLDQLMTQTESQPKHGWDQPGGYKVWVDKRNSDFRVVHSEVLGKVIHDYYSDSEIHKAGSSFMGFSIEPNFCMANRTRFVPENLGSGGGWHRDEVFRHGFKSLLYLVDVNEENGPLQLLPRTQTWSFHLADGTADEQYKYTEHHIEKLTHKDEQRIVTLSAKAGTLLLFETNLIHRGKPVSVGTRYALTNYFKGA